MSRAALYLYDFFMMKLIPSIRQKQLTYDYLICRFCVNPINLLSSWQCECGHKRPGNYFGRCPNCLSFHRHIDCPSCGFTMDVR